MNNWHFVYQPPSGSRFIPGAAPRPDIITPAVVWGNGCAHAFGALISVRAADPNKHWRDLACLVAGELAQLLGGVAWDANGEVSVVVPAQAAGKALEVLWGADPYTHHNLGRLLTPEFDDLRAVLAALGPIAIPRYLDQGVGLNGQPPALTYTVGEEEVEGKPPRRTVTFAGENPPPSVAASWAVSAIFGAAPAQ